MAMHDWLRDLRSRVRYEAQTIEDFEQLRRRTDVTYDDGKERIYLGPVEEVIAVSDDYAVYFDDGELIRYVCRDGYEVPNESEFNVLWNRVVRAKFIVDQLGATHSKGQLDALRMMLGQAVGTGLEGYPDAMRVGLDELDKFLYGKTLRNAKVLYVRTALRYTFGQAMFALTVVLIIYALSYDDTISAPLADWGYVIGIGAMGGAFGALFSVLTGTQNETPFDPLSSARYASFEAKTRILVGILGGILMAIAYQIGIIDSSLTHVEPRIAGMFMLSVVAGFAERLVPELLASQKADREGIENPLKRAGKHSAKPKLEEPEPEEPEPTEPEPPAPADPT